MIIDPDMRIPLSDGIYLSARVWMPQDANSNPVPAILEYLPYRKTDGTAERDHGMHAHFARSGYVCLRVDRRGCGDSEGLFDDEYSEQELSDGVEVINWIAQQPWCSGSVGIQGISWGGFNGVQLAARAPEPLKAVISIGTTVDRYRDDIHYKGGIQLCENVGWAATVLSWFSMPPDPEIVGEAWRDMWLERLENTPFLASRWIRHANRDAYWKHGSVCEDYSAIKAPVLVMGGLHDGYRNAMAHLAENLSAPVKSIIGPWSHKYPNISTIEPSVDYLGLAVRWWDHWLKGIDRGVDGDPAYTAYLMNSVTPNPSLNKREGAWIAEHVWPSPDINIVSLELDSADERNASTKYDSACGRASGEFFPFGFGPGELPDDQQHDDALSLCFDLGPFDTTQQFLGAPNVELHLSCDARVGQVVVRLCDLRPDGTSNLISLGMLNLRHRDGFETVKPLVPGMVYSISVPLDQTAYSLPEGHRLRVAVSNSYWPYCWPEGEVFSLEIAGGRLDLPVRNPTNMRQCHFSPPEKMDARQFQNLRNAEEWKTWNEDNHGTISLEIGGDHGARKDLESGLITSSKVVEHWSIRRDDPASAWAEITWWRSFGRDDWEVSSLVTTKMHGTKDDFIISQLLEVFEGETKIFEKLMEDCIPRYAQNHT